MSVQTDAKRKEGGFAETVRVVFHALIIALVIRTFLFQPFNIPSGSMIPTLLVGDWLFVNKLAYGPTVPFTNTHLPGYTTPKHNDVMTAILKGTGQNRPYLTGAAWNNDLHFASGSRATTYIWIVRSCTPSAASITDSLTVG